MKKALILAIGLIWPATSQAGVKVEVNVGHSCNSSRSCNASHEVTSYYDDWDDDDFENAWYEETGHFGPRVERVEYRWVRDCNRWVLRFRTVSFHSIRQTWDFGPWQVSVDYCHPGCGVRHVHRHYQVVRPIYRGPVCYRGHKHYKKSKVYRYYQYEPPRSSRCEIRSEGTRVYSAPEPVRRYEQPSGREQEPVRRPAVRVTPNQVTETRHSAPVASSQQPTRVYRSDQSSNSAPTRSSESSTIVRTSERVRVW